MLPASTPWGEQAAERLLAVDVSPDGKTVAVGTDYTSKVMLWDVASGRSAGEIEAFDSPVESVVLFDSESKGIWAAGSQDKYIRHFKLPVRP